VPNYNYYCKRCDVNHTQLRKYEERDKFSTCPECGKQKCPMTYDISKSKGSTGVLIKGGGTPKYYGNEGSLRSVHNQFLRESIEDTKEAVSGKTGVSPYSKMDIDHEYWKQKGVAKKQNDNEATIANAKRQKIVAEATQKSMTKKEQQDMKERHGVKDVKKIKTKNSK